MVARLVIVSRWGNQFDKKKKGFVDTAWYSIFLHHFISPLAVVRPWQGGADAIAAAVLAATLVCGESC